MGHGEVCAGVPEPLVVLALRDAVAGQEGDHSGEYLQLCR